MKSFSVYAPASSANLGPGFDTFALALDLWTRVDIKPDGSNRLKLASDLDLLGGNNLVMATIDETTRQLGTALPGGIVHISSDVPIARGLGSSSAAIVCGILAAGKLTNTPLTASDLINIGGMIEGHADNVAAAVLGGVTAALQTETGFIAESLATEFPWQPVLYIPEETGYTAEARGVLPGRIPMADAVANLGRSALMVHALYHQREDLIRIAMQDRLHQPYRAAIFPHLNATVEAAELAGSLGACLSGAGPTILALGRREDAAAIGKAMAEAGMRTGVPGSVLAPEVVSTGGYISIS